MDNMKEVYDSRLLGVESGDQPEGKTETKVKEDSDGKAKDEQSQQQMMTKLASETNEDSETKEQDNSNDRLDPSTDFEALLRGNIRPSFRMEERRGRPAKAIWQLYDRVRRNGTGRIVRAHCKFCGRYVAPRPAETMLAHARNCRAMREGCDEKEYLELTTGPSTMISPRRLRHPRMIDSAARAKILTGAKPSAELDARLHEGMSNLIGDGTDNKVDSDLYVARFLISTGLPFTVLDTSEFKDMINSVSHGQYKAPSGIQLTKTCLTRLDGNAEKQAATDPHKLYTAPDAVTGDAGEKSRGKNGSEEDARREIGTGNDTKKNPSEAGPAVLSSPPSSPLPSSRAIATSALEHAEQEEAQ